jgi:hypothetical protein
MFGGRLCRETAGELEPHMAASAALATFEPMLCEVAESIDVSA